MTCTEATETETYLGAEAIPKWQDMSSFFYGRSWYNCKWLPP